jgi:hypothetical protein
MARLSEPPKPCSRCLPARAVAPFPSQAHGLGLALTQADLDDMTLDLWAQVNSSPLGSAYILFGNVTVTITYG